MRPRKGWTRQPGVLRLEDGELGNDLDRRRREPHLLLGLAERRREHVRVARLGLAAGEAQLAAVLSAVVGARDDDDPQLAVRVAVDRDEDCRVP